MIKLQINERLGDRSYWWLAQTSKVNYTVVRNLASQRSQQITYATLEKLCDALECEPGDLLVRVSVPEK
jgi:DNA-binding Xre family transcriptional regulator